MRYAIEEFKIAVSVILAIIYREWQINSTGRRGLEGVNGRERIKKTETPGHCLSKESSVNGNIGVDGRNF